MKTLIAASIVIGLLLLVKDARPMGVFTPPLPNPLCKITWIPPAERINTIGLSPSEIAYYEVWMFGRKIPIKFPGGTATQHTWKADQCPKCGSIRLKTVLTDGSKSVLSEPEKC